MLGMSDSASATGDASYFLELGWRKGPDDYDVEEKEEAPTHLNTNTSVHFLVVSTDKLSATYIGEGLHGNDVGSIQGNRPAPCKKILYYFEISVKDRGQKGCISIGFSDKQFKTGRQPGWEPNSYGYHGDDGKLYHGQGRGDNFGSTFTVHDTVGAGINYASQEIFFTKNGKLIGTYSKEVKVPLYPTIGLHSANEKVDVNFGQQPFVFDIEALAQEERERRQRAIENVSLSLGISHSIVRAYLLHYGYKDTLDAFDSASGNMVPPVVLTAQENGNKVVDEVSHAISERKNLRQLIRDGDVDGVFSKLSEWYPHLLQDELSIVSFLLHCQKFIELIKAGSLESAVAYAREKLARYFGKFPYHNLLQDCVALLAYEKPAESSVGYLLKLGQREAVADAINSVVLATNPLLPSTVAPRSSLEKLLRQLTTCYMEKHLLNGGQGEVFRLHRVLQGTKDGAW